MEVHCKKLPNSIGWIDRFQCARRFPTTLNPTLWVDVRPLVYERKPGNGLDQKDALIYFSLRQPIELGHQTTHRHAIAKAAPNTLIRTKAPAAHRHSLERRVIRDPSTI